MPTYISLVNLTEQGVKEVKNAPERLRAFPREEFEQIARSLH